MTLLASFAGKRLLAVDPGSRYVGLATRTSLIAGVQRFGLLERTRPSARLAGSADGDAWSWTLQRLARDAPRRQEFRSQAAALEAVLREQRIVGVIYGMPYLACGSRSRESEEVLRQVRRLREEWQTPVPILLWDETWSTRIAVGPRQRRGKRDAQWTHASAACQILHEVVRTLRPLEKTQGAAALEGGGDCVG